MSEKRMQNKPVWKISIRVSTVHGNSWTIMPFHVINITNIIFIEFDIFFLFSFSSCRFDFDTQAISPPAHDDSFFYIRYPISESVEKSSGISHSISEAISKSDIKLAKPLKQQCDQNILMKHTEPCKKYLNNKERGERMDSTCNHIVVLNDI